MLSTRRFLFTIVLLTVSAFLIPEYASAYYYVSGVVDLNYRGYETEQAGVKTSYHTVTESLQTSLSGDLVDPRLMKFTASAGYTNYSVSNAVDSTLLNYNLYTTFFPGMKVSWDLYGTQSIQTVQSEADIAGYDVTNTNYGAVLNLGLNRKRSSSNNNNNININNNFNNNLNNNNRDGLSFSLPVPDVTVSYNHAESESISSDNPLHETRDDTKGKFAFVNSGGSVILNAGRSEYENLLNQSAYQQTSLDMQSSFKVTGNTDLSLNGTMSNRDSQDDPSGDGESRSYGATLNIRETDDLRHYYRYSFAESESSGSDTVSEAIEAQMQYHVAKELWLRGGLNYSISESIVSSQTTTDVTETDESKLETGGLVLGAMYAKTYKPELLGPFSLTTNYNFDAGYLKSSSPTDPDWNGHGHYYSNAFSLGIPSTAWKQDNLNFDYSFLSKRDHSSLANNMLQHQFRATGSTIRINRTTLRAVISYIIQEINSESSDLLFTTSQNTNQESRSYSYDFSADHVVTRNLGLRAGAARTESKTTSNTLAETSEYASIAKTYDDVYYAEANFRYPIRRNLLYRAKLRDEYRRGATTDSQNYQAETGLDYRFRQVTVNMEYRYRHDIYETSPRSTQQYYFAKITRPF